MNIFIIAFIIGLLMPSICLYLNWRQERNIRLHCLFFIALLIVQIICEAFLAKFNLAHLIKYSSAIFVFVRLLHLTYLFQLKESIKKRQPKVRHLIRITYWANILLWPLILIRLISKITY